MARVFHGFEITEKIGSGGMSTVYKGVHGTLGYPVAIKTLHGQLAEDESFISRFEREAKAASSLKHNNIVSVIDFGSEDDVYFIIMEFVDGHDLAKLFDGFQDPHQPPRPFPAEITLILIEEVAYGLKAAHDQGIIHRDIKPSNVMINKQGEVKLADFGLAREVRTMSRLLARDLTTPGMIVGTPSYMSPEQAAGSETIDHRTDIFSLGVVAYQFLTGVKPFTGSSPSEIQERIISAIPPAITKELCPRITPQIAALVEKMLAKDPGKRFQSMDQVLRSLADCMESVDASNAAIKFRRSYLSQFALDPRGFSEELRRTTISGHLQRGFHFKNMGHENIGNAMSEFENVLMLDPDNSKAVKALTELEQQRGSAAAPEAEPSTEASGQTMVMPAAGAMDTTRPPGSKATAGKPAAADRGREAAAGPKKGSPIAGLLKTTRGRIVAGAVGLIVVVAAILGIASRQGSPPPSPPAAVEAGQTAAAPSGGTGLAPAPTPATQAAPATPAAAAPGEGASGTGALVSSGGATPGGATRPDGSGGAMTPPAGGTGGASGTGGTSGDKGATGAAAALVAQQSTAQQAAADSAAQARRRGTLQFKVSPPCDVYLNGKQVAAHVGDGPVLVAPGKYQLELRSPSIFGYKRMDVEVAARKAVPVEHEFKTGTLVLKIDDPKAEVVIDGIPVDRSRGSSFEVATGRHRLGIRRDGYKVSRITDATSRTGGQMLLKPLGEDNGLSIYEIEINDTRGLRLEVDLRRR